MQPGWKWGSRGRGVGLALLCALAALASAPAGAEEAAQSPVKLEQLLRLPDSLEVRPEPVRRGGATRTEWQSRFEDADAEQAAAEAALASARSELAELAAGSSAWKMGTPGLPSKPSSDEASPLDYELSQRLRRSREDVARSERRLRELRVQADLAGVPGEWITPPPETPPDGE